MSIAVSKIYGFITRAAQIKLSLNAFGWVLVYHCLYFLTPIKFGYFDIVLIYINIYMYIVMHIVMHILRDINVVYNVTLDYKTWPEISIAFFMKQWKWLFQTRELYNKVYLMRIA